MYLDGEDLVIEQNGQQVRVALCNVPGLAEQMMSLLHRHTGVIHDQVRPTYDRESIS